MGSELSICKKCRKTRWLAVINTCSHCVSTAVKACHGQGHDQRSFDGREGLDHVTDRTSRPSKPRDGCHPMTPKRRGDGSLGLCDQDPLDAGLPHKKDRSSSPRVLEKVGTSVLPNAHHSRQCLPRFGNGLSPLAKRRGGRGLGYVLKPYPSLIRY